jgi:plasmid stabilization system protein ParE
MRRCEQSENRFNDLEIIPQAQHDIAEAARYYQQRRAGLDAEFLSKVDEVVATIARDPLRFEQIRPGIRRCFLERFPYGIYYRLPDAVTLRIIIVRHHRRRPGFGMRRK